MPSTTTLDLVVRILAVDKQSLAKWRDDDGLTLAEIRDRLRDEYRITVAIETVRRWLSELTEPAEAAS